VSISNLYATQKWNTQFVCVGGVGGGVNMCFSFLSLGENVKVEVSYDILLISFQSQ
jgi:hypothetical protein